MLPWERNPRVRKPPKIRPPGAASWAVANAFSVGVDKFAAGFSAMAAAPLVDNPLWPAPLTEPTFRVFLNVSTLVSRSMVLVSSLLDPIHISSPQQCFLRYIGFSLVARGAGQNRRPSALHGKPPFPHGPRFLIEARIIPRRRGYRVRRGWRRGHFRHFGCQGSNTHLRSPIWSASTNNNGKALCSARSLQR